MAQATDKREPSTIVASMHVTTETQVKACDIDWAALDLIALHIGYGSHITLYFDIDELDHFIEAVGSQRDRIKTSRAAEADEEHEIAISPV